MKWKKTVFEATGLSALEQRQQLLGHHVRMVAKQMSHALFVFGSQGGLGKTRTILKVPDEEGVEPVLVNRIALRSPSTRSCISTRRPVGFLFDDVDSLFSSMAHLGLLRSALWGTPRTVFYGSSQLPNDLPSRFETTSRFIFAANVIPKKNDAFKAVLIRCDIFELSATNDEVIDLMRCVASRGFEGSPPRNVRA